MNLIAVSAQYKVISLNKFGYKVAHMYDVGVNSDGFFGFRSYRTTRAKTTHAENYGRIYRYTHSGNVRIACGNIFLFETEEEALNELKKRLAESLAIKIQKIRNPALINYNS